MWVWCWLGRVVRGVSVGWWLVAGWVSRPGVLSKGPGPVLAGQSEAEESFEVDGGRPVDPPRIVLDCAAIWDAPGASGQPGEGAFDHGAVLSIHGLKVGMLGANAVFAAEPVVGMDSHLLPQFRLRALGHEGAGRAGTTKTYASLRTDRPDDARRTRRGVSSMVKSSMVNPPGIARPKGIGLMIGV